MYQRRCRKCGSHSLFTEQHGNNTGCESTVAIVELGKLG